MLPQLYHHKTTGLSSSYGCCASCTHHKSRHVKVNILHDAVCTLPCRNTRLIVRLSATKYSQLATSLTLIRKGCQPLSHPMHQFHASIQSQLSPPVSMIQNQALRTSGCWKGRVLEGEWVLVGSFGGGVKGMPC